MAGRRKSKKIRFPMIANMSAHGLRRNPRHQQAWKVTERQFVLARRTHDEFVRTIDARVLVLVAGVGARQ